MVVEQLNPTEKKIQVHFLTVFENSQKFSFYQINNRIYNCNVWLENSYGTFLVIFNHSVQPTKPTFVQADTKIL